MSCYHPLRAFESLRRTTENGKKLIIFNESELKDENFVEIEMPCGQCIGCRIDRTRDWAVRCMHEAQCYEHNCFITLTYNDDCLPVDRSVNIEEFQRFIKNFRRRYDGIDRKVRTNGVPHYPIRYFHCGEYGDQLDRPHYHACIFNFDFGDKQFWKRTELGDILYTSEELSRLWSEPIESQHVKEYDSSIVWQKGSRWYVRKGFCTTTDVTARSAAYVARYVTKKITGDRANDHYIKVDHETGEMFRVNPEYASMSLRPGIGSEWLEKYGKTDVYSKDFLTLEGKYYKTPKYYDKCFDEAVVEQAKVERRQKAWRHRDDQTSERRKVKKICQEKRLKKLHRGIENDL